MSTYRKFFSIPLATAAGTLAAALGAAAMPADVQAGEFQGMSVEVVGEGKPVLMIPGLNSGADTWRDTCMALQPQVQCHLVQLPGFAGQPAVDGDAFLEGMRDRLLAYLEAEELEEPVVIGHSLGGVLGMRMAIEQPDAIDRLVIVDSLPFFPAAQNPAATVEQARPMAEQMRAAWVAADDATYAAQAEAALSTMARAPEDVAKLREWGRASDRATTTQAMYELMTTDLRDSLGRISAPTLVLGSWAAYQLYGATLESTRATFAGQYANLDGVRIEMSADGYHFLMWDDPQWLQEQVREFIGATPGVVAR